MFKKLRHKIEKLLIEDVEDLLCEASEAESEPDLETESLWPPPPPRTIRELETLVQTKNVKCTCDICSPEKYTGFHCLKRPHLKLDIHKHLTTNKLGHSVYAPPKLVSHRAWAPEVMHLVRSIVTYFDRPWEYLNDEQLAARENFCRWRDARWADIVRIPDEVDGRSLLPEAEMRQLWTWINEIFFGGDLLGAKFRWNASINAHGEESHRFLHGALIEMHPTIICGDYGGYAILHFISVLVHEAIHAFIAHYPCSLCRSQWIDCNLLDHGRAFQILAANIEEVFPRLLGLPVKLNRWESLIGDWPDIMSLPSIHDLTTWRLNCIDLSSPESEDVLELIQCTRSGIYGYSPKIWLKGQRKESISKLPQRVMVRDEEGTLVTHVLRCIVNEERPSEEHDQVPEAGNVAWNST